MKTSSLNIMRLPAALLLVLLTITGCNTPRPSATEERLLQIDSLLNHDADSAISLLEEFSDSLVRTPRDSALFTLLSAESRYKTFIEDTSDCHVSRAARYFINTGDRHNAMRALFLQGHIRITTGRTGEAIVSLLAAEEFADTSADHLYLGKIYSSISEIYSKIGDTPQETEYAKLAYKQYQKLDSLIFIQESALDYGLAQCRNGMSDKGLPLINKILKDAMSKNNVEMATTSLIYLGTAHLWNNDWVNSKKAYDSYASYNHLSNLPYGHLTSYLSCLIALNSPADSIKMIADTVKYLYGTEEIPFDYYIYSNDYKNAFNTIQREYRLLDNRLISKMRSDVGNNLRNFRDNKIAKQKLDIKLEQKRNFWLYITIALLIIIFALFSAIISLIYKKRKTNLLRTVELLKSQKIEIKETLDTIINENSYLSEKLSSLSSVDNVKKSAEYVGYIFNRLDGLYSSYFGYFDSEKKRASLLQDMGKEIQYLNNDPKLTQEMEGIINIIHDNLLNDVYVSISINKNQRKLAALRCLNFSKESISALSGISIQAYYNRMRRLIDCISQSTSDRTHELIKIIKD